MRMRNLLLAGLLLAFGAGGASATTIQYHVSFGAGNFTANPNPTSAAVPLLVTGSFDVDLDIGTSPSEQTAGLHNTSIGAIDFTANPYPFVVDTPWAFSYDKTTDILVVGGSQDGAGIIHFGAPTANDFYLQIHDFSTANPLMWQLGFSQTLSPGSNFFNTAGGAPADGFVFVTAGGPVATTPLPAGLPLFLTAIGGLGAALVARRRNLPASAIALS
jgi:hypothetical protein